MTNLLPDLLFDQSIVSSFTVLEHVPSDLDFLLKLRITLTDQSALFTHERILRSVRKYSFHWQTMDNRAIMRWDNAPHHRQITTFPHHLHDYRSTPETVGDSHNITLTEVLDYIRRYLNQPTKP